MKVRGVDGLGVHREGETKWDPDMPACPGPPQGEGVAWDERALRGAAGGGIHSPALYQSSHSGELWSVCVCVCVCECMCTQFSRSVVSALTLCDPMDCSTPGLPVRHQFLEFTQTHVH